MVKRNSSKSWENHNYRTVFKIVVGLPIFTACVFLLILITKPLLLHFHLLFLLVTGYLMFLAIYAYNAMKELENCDVRFIEGTDMLKIKKEIELALLKNNYSFKIKNEKDIFQSTTIDYRLANLKTGMQIIYNKKKNSGVAQIVRINIDENDIKIQLKNMVNEIIEKNKS